MPTSLRHDREFLLELGRKVDEVLRGMRRHLRKWEVETAIQSCTRLADLRDYFLYLTLDALEDRELSKELVGTFEELEKRSETHSLFFFALAQLLSVKHELGWEGEKISREDFERSWRQTARELGLVSKGEDLRELFLATLRESEGAEVEWWERERFEGRELVLGTERIPIPPDQVVCDVCRAPVVDFPAPVLIVKDLPPSPTLRVEEDKILFSPFSGRVTLCKACWEEARRVLEEKGWRG